MIEIKINIDKNQLRQIEEMPEEAHRGLLKGVRKAALYAEAKAKGNFNKQGKPSIRSGQLRRSITSGVKEDTGWIGSDLVYARIQEEGGRISARMKPYLAFQVNGHWVKKKSVNIPARPYLAPAITDNIDRIGEIIAQEILEELN